MLSQPDGMATWMHEVMSIPVGELLRVKAELGEDVRTKMLAGIAGARKAPPLKPMEHRAVSERLKAIERAGLLVVNIRDQSERASAEQLVAYVHRHRKDNAVFQRHRRLARLSTSDYRGGGQHRGPARRRSTKAVGRVCRTIRQHSN